MTSTRNFPVAVLLSAFRIWVLDRIIQRISYNVALNEGAVLLEIKFLNPLAVEIAHKKLAGMGC